MLISRQNLQGVFPSTENLSVLLVSPHAEDEVALREMLPRLNAPSVQRCATTEQALSLIRQLTPAVVMCERDLPDGNWRTILATCEVQQKPPILVVVSRHADENLWAEVLNLGGYDVILKPFDRWEVTRVVASSCRYWAADGPLVRQQVASADRPARGTATQSA